MLALQNTIIHSQKRVYVIVFFSAVSYKNNTCYAYRIPQRKTQSLFYDGLLQCQTYDNEISDICHSFHSLECLVRSCSISMVQFNRPVYTHWSLLLMTDPSPPPPASTIHHIRTGHQSHFLQFKQKYPSILRKALIQFQLFLVEFMVLKCRDHCALNSLATVDTSPQQCNFSLFHWLCLSENHHGHASYIYHVYQCTCATQNVYRMSMCV